MTTLPTKQLITAEEFCEWANCPDNQSRQYQLDRGEVIEVTRPAELHGVLCAWIAHLLRSYALQRGRGCVYQSGNERTAHLADIIRSLREGG